MLKQIINKLSINPKQLFLIDGLGAFLTAFFLIAVLGTFHEYIGMPKKTLTFLSIIAAIFCVYSISCFFLLKKNWRPFLIAISMANLLYCCLTVGLVIYHYSELSVLGIAYFLGEIMIVGTLVFVELKVVNTHT